MQNKEILARFINECWNAHNKSICDELLSPDYKHYMPGVPEPTIGPAGYKQLVDAFLTGFPDTRFEVEEVFGEGDRVCVVWTARGTHQGVFNGVAPTQRPIEIKGVGVGRIVDGKIVEIASHFDNASFAKQLGTEADKAAESWKPKSR
jgi:steroid delta-isomerase-like uncharacterized protein